MNRRHIALGALVLAAAALGMGWGTARADATPSQSAYDKFKGLEGTWQGVSTKGWKERIVYKAIAKGSCVMETSFDAHPNEMMVTMVHPDGDRLLLTHYCVAQNQPRLQATEFSDDGKIVTFTYVDGTNLKSRDQGHMDKVIFRFLETDRFTSRWTWYQDGKESWMEEIVYTRVKATETQPERATPESVPTEHH